MKNLSTGRRQAQEPVKRPLTLGDLVRQPATLRDLAKEAGCSYSLIAKVSTGERKPNAAIKAAVERLFQVPASLLWPEDD